MTQVYTDVLTYRPLVRAELYSKLMLVTSKAALDCEPHDHIAAEHSILDILISACIDQRTIGLHRYIKWR
jgi:hypothetical protein